MLSLTDENNYVTPTGAASPLKSRFPRFFLHMAVLGIYWKCSRQAVKGMYDDDMWTQQSIDVVRALESIGIRLNVEGLDVLHGLSGPCVFVANHMSVLEVLVFPSLLQRYNRFTFIVKDSLKNMPLFKNIMFAIDPVRVGRINPRNDLKTVLKDGVERIERGISILAFPQTTRYEKFEPSRFNTIGAKLARRAGVPLVPIALKTDAWSVGKLIKDFGPIRPERTVHFSIGPPLEVTGNGREQHEETVRFIQDKLASWG